ncbi:hypothetical protein F5B17DRAFT_454134 [Nemania serpens]|nr:hypothetical protein F5B17DRAFT_454134 [Nemania serpens]
MTTMQPKSPRPARRETVGVSPLSIRIPDWAITRRYRSLWARRIGDFAALKHHLKSTTAFVSFDIELHQDGRISEIGLAYLPSTGHERPVEIMRFAATHAVDVRCLKTPSLGRKEPARDRENFKWRFEEPTVQEIDADLAEAKIIEFLEHVRSVSGVEHITLIGFAMGAEFKFLFHQVPAVITYISAWVDIQPIVWEVDWLAGTRTDHHHNLPAMTVAMAGYGFEKGYQSTKLNHCAANDAVRILALLACLANTPASGFPMELERLQHERPQPQFRPRKGPLSKPNAFIFRNHPFRAVVRMQDGNCPGHEIRTPLRLEQFFAQYPIKAIGQHGRHTDGHPMKCCRLYFYVSFSNADELAIFVKENDRRPLRCGRQLKVFQQTDKPVDRNGIVSTRVRDKANTEKVQEEGLGLDFISIMEDMLIEYF